MTHKKFTAKDFKAYSDYRPPNVLHTYLSMGLLILLVSIFLGVTISVGESLANRWFVGLLIFSQCVVICFTILLGIWWSIRLSTFSAKKERLLKQTLDALGWTTGTYPSINDWPVVPSSVVHNLDTSTSGQHPLYLKFQGELEGSPAEFVFLDARPFIFSGNAAYTYIHVALADSYPHTIVDGKDGILKHDLLAKINNVEHVSLEGELSKYFNVYAIKNNGQSSLYTLSPDVLVHLLDYGTKFNIEVLGNSLYIFSNPSVLENSQQFADFMNLALYLSKQFGKRAKARGIRDSEFRYNSGYAQKRMDIKSSITGISHDDMSAS